jgi:hypothetical protein
MMNGLMACVVSSMPGVTSERDGFCATRVARGQIGVPSGQAGGIKRSYRDA